jgi:O-antigen/teichoic acid export membrane protein
MSLLEMSYTSSANTSEQIQTKLSVASCAAPSSLSLRQNFSWTMSGNVVYAGCQWGILAVLAKLCPPETVGVFALALALATPVMMLLDLQLRSVQATDSKEEYRFGEYLGLRLITTAVGFVVIAVLAFGSGHHGSTLLVILGVAVFKCIEAFSEGLRGLFQQRERMDLIAKSLIIKGMLALTLATAGLLLTHALMGTVIGMCLGYFLVLIFYEMPCCSMLLKDDRAYWPIWSSGRLWQLAWVALPLGIVQMLFSLSSNLPRYFIERYRGPGELGIFAVLAAFILVGGTVVNAMGLSALPRLARYFADGDYRGFRQLLTRMVGFGVILGLAGIAGAAIFGHTVLLWIYQPIYAEHTQTLLLIMLCATITYVAGFLSGGMMAVRLFRAQLPVLTASTLATLAACQWLVPAMGMNGAVVAMSLGMATLAIGSLLVVLLAIHNSLGLHYHSCPTSTESGTCRGMEERSDGT